MLQFHDSRNKKNILHAYALATMDDVRVHVLGRYSILPSIIGGQQDGNLSPLAALNMVQI